MFDGFWIDFGWFRKDFDGFWMVFLDGFRLALDGFRLDFGWIFCMDFLHGFWMVLECIWDGFWLDFGWMFDGFWMV